MKKAIYYCDICGKRITKKTKIETKFFSKLRLLGALFCLLTFQPQINYDIEEVCNGCFVSFKRWIKYRGRK